MGRAWAKNLEDCADCTLAGWIDVSDDALARAVAETGISPAYLGTDLVKAIDELRPDFVVDITPPEVHSEVTLAALSAGIPVIGEKPMSTTMADAKAMVAAADKAGKLYMVSQSRRYKSEIRSYEKLIQSFLGPIEILNSDFYIGAHFGGFRDAMPSVLLLDMAIHTFDEARFLSGADAVSVYAEEFNPTWSWYEGAASANAMFEMTGGLRFTYRGSWCAEGCHTSWDASWRAVGPNGTALWNGDEMPYADVVTERGGFHARVRRLNGEYVSVPDGIAGSLREFLHALETGSTPHGECHDNIKSLAMVFAAVESSRTGKRVKVEV